MSCSFPLCSKVIQIALGWEDPLQQGMAVTLAFSPGEPVDRGARRATVCACVSPSGVSDSLRPRGL